MATTELDILMQQKIDNDTKIMYPVTKVRNIINDENDTLEDILSNQILQYIENEKLHHYETHTNYQWIKLCNIKWTKHNQGEFIFFKIFIGESNNARTNQNAYMDLIMQKGYYSSTSTTELGYMGCNAIFYPLETQLTLDSVKIKVMVNDKNDYDLWGYINRTYSMFSWYHKSTTNITITEVHTAQADEPTGTECNLSCVLCNMLDLKYAEIETWETVE